MDWRAFVPVVATIAAAAITAPAALGDTVEQFYKGKRIELVVGANAGTGYDDYARLLARHITRHIPGEPLVIVKNMGGAGGRTAINYVYTIMAKDGLGFGSTLKNIPFDPLYGVDATKIDATKMNWLGSLNSEVSLCVIWHTKGIRSMEDARAKEILIGSPGATTTDAVVARMMNLMAGTKLKLVQGYASSTLIHLAMEKGEVDGRCGLGYDQLISRYQHWVADKQVTILSQFALKKHPDLPHVPFIMDLALTEEHKQMAQLLIAPNEMGRPFFAPPDVPAERIAALRKGLAGAAKDPELLAEAGKQNIAVTLMPGEEMEQFVRQIYKTPKEVVERAKTLVEGP